MKTINKFRLGIIVFVALFVTSCEKDNLELATPVSENKEMSVTEPVTLTFDYKYKYKGQIYTEKEWQDKYKNVETPSFSIIGLNEMLYVFDEIEEANVFEKEELKSIMRLDLERKNKISLTKKNSRTNADKIIATASVSGSIAFYENINLRKPIYTVYFNEDVELRQNWWGQQYKANNVFQSNLRLMNKKVSGFTMTFTKGGSLPGPSYAIPLTMTATVNSAPIPKPSGTTNYSYSRILYNDPPYATKNTFTDSDLTDNPLIPFLPVVGNNTWNDAAESYKVEFW